MRKRFLALMAMVMLVAGSLLAVPAYRGWQTKVQPDGTTITVRLNGDEFYHYWTNEQGQQVKQDENGYWQVVGTEPTPAQVIQRKQNSPMWQSSANGPHRVGKLNLAPRGLFILVNFSDKSFTSTNTQSAMNDMMNAESYTYNGAVGSARKYFIDQSNGAYTPTFDVVGPVTLTKAVSYYGSNNDGTAGNDAYAGDMIVEACKLADTECGVDFTKYDNDGDGYIDFVYVIYAGKGEADGGAATTIWPHNWNLASAYSYGNCTYSSSQRKVDGKYINNYACSGEINGQTNKRAGIGTLCHEFSHVLGLPDYYDTEYGTNYSSNLTPGDWSIMDAGSYNSSGNCPPNYSIYDKWYMGWAGSSTIKVLNAAANVTLPDPTQAENYGVGYYINSNGSTISSATSSTATQYFLENRQQSGWDASLPGHGMIVWKVTYSSSVWSNNAPNNTANNPRYTVVSAKGTAAVQGSNYDPFPGSGSKKTYTPFSTYPLTNITENTTAKTVSFLFMGGVTNYTVTFNANGGSCSTASLTEASSGAGVTLPTATRDGYDFLGWATSSSATTANAGAAGATYNPSGNITLYAVWRQNTIVNLSSDLEGVTPNTALGTTITKASGFTRTFTAADGYSDLKYENYLVELTIGGVDKTDTYVSLTGSTLTVSIPTSALTDDVVLTIVNDKKPTVEIEATGATPSGNAATVEKNTNFQCTLTPASGCQLTVNDIEVQMGSTALVAGTNFTYVGTTLTVKNVTGDLYIRATAKAGITWNVKGETTVTYQTMGAALALPTAPADCDAQVVFAGWTATQNYTHATDAPADLFKTSKGNVSAAATYYAVYAQQTSGGVPTTETLSASYGSATGWTVSGAGGSSYWILKSGASITTPEFDLSNVQSIVVNMRTYGGSSYKTVVVKQGSTTIGSLSATSSSLTDYTLASANFTNSPSGTGALTFSSSTANSDNGPGVKSITITYKTGGATYVNYNYQCFTAEKEAPTCSFSTLNKSLTVNETFTQTVNTNSTGAVTYTSSNTGVATVNSTSGLVTAVAEGTATITASVAAAGAYTAGSAQYTVTVTAAAVVTPDPGSAEPDPECSIPYADGYYSSLDNKSGKDLFDAIQAVAKKGYSSLTYDGLWTAYCTTDVEGGYIVDYYNDQSKFTCGSSAQGASASNIGDGYNREHSIPKSWFGGSTSSKTPGTDIFHVVPTDVYTNSQRSNLAYGEVESAAWTSSTGGGKRGTAKTISGQSCSTNVFEPMDKYKGDLARGYMGTLLHWAGDYQAFTTGDGAKIFSGTYTDAGHYGLTPYGVALLMKWHKEDPVSDRERARNNAIQSTQGNRNPFIDYPDLADYLWGDLAGQVLDIDALNSSYCTSSVVEPDPYSVTYSRHGVETTVNNLTIATYTLISNGEEGPCDVWPWDGWSTTSVTATSTKPDYVTTVTETTKVYAVYKKDGVYNSNPVCPTAVDPTFAFANASVTITYGEGISNTLNTNTDGAITYTSTNTSVAAIEGGVVVVKGVGTTTIKASAAATANYNAANAQYTLTVNKATPTLAFQYSSRAVTVGETTQNVATATPAATVTYTSSNTTVATVNSSTGVVSGVKAGTATITARVAATTNYNAAEKSYVVTVSEAAVVGGKYTVTWVVNGVTLRAYTEQVQDGQKPSQMPGTPGNIDCENPTYVFKGWSSDGGVNLYTTLDEVPAVTAAVTYVAVFGE